MKGSPLAGRDEDQLAGAVFALKCRGIDFELRAVTGRAFQLLFRLEQLAVLADVVDRHVQDQKILPIRRFRAAEAVGDALAIDGDFVNVIIDRRDRSAFRQRRPCSFQRQHDAAWPQNLSA